MKDKKVVFMGTPKFSLNVLEDKYSEDGNLEEALRFFSDIIYY